MQKETRNGLLAVGGVLGAIGASSCCALPLLFVSAGISGAWIGALTSLAPYQPVFIGIAVACIAAGFWMVYGRREAQCDGPMCGSTTSRRLTKTGLWVATLKLGIAVTVGWWALLLA